MSEHEGVWVFSEDYNLMLELLAAGAPVAAGLKADLTCVLLGDSVEGRAGEILKYGADKILVVEKPQLKDLRVEACLSVLTHLAANQKPEIILIGSTKNGKELASRLAARLETGCTPDCTQLSIDDEGRLVTKRIVYSGNAVVTATYKKKPQIATVPARAFEKLQPTERKGRIAKAEVEIGEPKLEIVEVTEPEMAEVKIEEARIAVCGGRGIEKKEDFKPLEQLAQLLGGQVGNSRPLAEDRKWFKSWVGLSGKKIKPVLYVGCGISGMIQHVAGMRDSNVIVAINKDPEAAMFEVADYIIVGDLYEIVPAIVEELRKTLK